MILGEKRSFRLLRKLPRCHGNNIQLVNKLYQADDNHSTINSMRSSRHFSNTDFDWLNTSLYSIESPIKIQLLYETNFMVRLSMLGRWCHMIGWIGRFQLQPTNERRCSITNGLTCCQITSALREWHNYILLLQRVSKLKKVIIIFVLLFSHQGQWRFNNARDWNQNYPHSN